MMTGAKFLGGLMMIAGFVLIKSEDRKLPVDEEAKDK